MSSTTANQEDSDERINNSSCNRTDIRSIDARSDVLSNSRTTDGDAMINRANQDWPREVYTGTIIDELTQVVQDVQEKREMQEEPEDERERRTR